MKIFVTILGIFFMQFPAWGKVPTAVQYCESLLESVTHAHTDGELLDTVEKIEFVFGLIAKDFPQVDLSASRVEVQELTDCALEGGDTKSCKRRLRTVLEHLLAQLPTEENTSSSGAEQITSVAQLILMPEKLAADKVYLTSHPHYQISFSHEVVADLPTVARPTVVQLLRAVQKGFTHAHSGASGIYRATDVHKNFFEIKMKGDERLVGCLEGSLLRVKKFTIKNNEGHAGTLAKKFKFLCE
jgi:hypothetical protein